MSILDKFSPEFHDFLNYEKKWMNYRAQNNLYYSSDPRWKGSEHDLEHREMRVVLTSKPVYFRIGLTDQERYIIDPYFDYGIEWFRDAYEKMISLRKAGALLEYGWPDSRCYLIGHLRPSEEIAARFVCMNCCKTCARDLSRKEFFTGEPDEKWITDVIGQYSKTCGITESAST